MAILFMTGVTHSWQMRRNSKDDIKDRLFPREPVFLRLM
ncbi:hypothetical protein C2W63_02717 [Bacillus velezensis]|nr:hypothetical protein C2W63_02717 [Bacillus velezensis]